MERIDKVAWIRIRYRKLLMAQLKDDDKPVFPGGEREPGESDLDVLVRKLDEQLGIIFLPETARHLGTFRKPVPGCEVPTELQASCWIGGEYEGEFMPRGEIKKVLWISCRDRHEQTPLTQHLLDILYNIGLID